MKKNLLYFSTFFFTTIFCLLMNSTVKAQTWTVYDGSALPNASTPAWASGDVGTPAAQYSIVTTTDNSFLYDTTTASGDKQSWKLNITKPETGTWLIRTKAAGNPASIEFEMNALSGGTTSRINIKLVNNVKGGYLQTNYLASNVSYPADTSLTVKDYHTYRITVENGNSFKVYLDENSTPIVTGTGSSTTNSQFLRFGDVGSTFTAGYVDWMAWDVTGAYAPGTTLPAGVIVDGASTPAAPSAPNATAATSATSTGFTANWDAAATATGYKLDVATDNAFTSMVTGYSDKDVANVTTFNITGLTAGTTYYYRVRAYNAGGTSALSSNVITVSTTGSTIAVTGITVTGAGGATTITTASGTLQMSADVIPVDATNKNVTWSVTNGTGEATINGSGLLTASKNGNVTVKATADDGSNVTGTLDITISGQSSSTKKKVGYFTFVKTLDATAATVQTDPVYLMLQADPNLDVTLNALTDVSLTATVDQSLYDVLVIQESFAGAAAILTPAGALGLAKLTKPTLFNKNYAFAKGRAFQANSTGGGAETQGSNTLESTLVSIKVDPSVQSHDLFKDITFAGDSVGLFTSGATDVGLTTGTGAIFKSINYATNVVISNTNTLLAKPVTVKTADQDILKVCFNDLPAGTVIGGNADQTVTGETLQTRIITVGMNFGAICASGGNNINANGLKIFKNAVYSLAGLNGSTTVKVTGITVTGDAGATTITTNGGTLQMNAAVTPSNATDKSVTWSVTNGTGEATISSSGLLTASKNGTVTVKATAADGSGIVGTLDITISGQTVTVTGVTVTGTGDATTITTKGGKLQMVATITPTDATNKNVTWSVTNGTGQATISAGGELQASKDGTVTVKATSADVNTIFGELVVTISGQSTGINVISGKSLEIYPNPVPEAIIIDKASAIKKFEVISLSGKILVQGTNNADKLSINVNKLSSGIYLLKVYTTEGALQVRFMKK